MSITLGPWSLFIRLDDPRIMVRALKDGRVDSDGELIAVVENETNARLIAAAPDTLATLEKTAKSLCSITCRRHLGEKTQHGNACERATAAIAKAKGDRYSDDT